MSDKLTKAKIRVIYDHPFFATLLMKKEFVADETVPKDVGMITNGPTIRFNPAYVDELNDEDAKGVICKMALQTALLHHTRRGDRDPEVWRRAGDQAVIPLILQNKMSLPGNPQPDSRFADMSVEGIYSELQKVPKPKPQPAPGQGQGKQGQGDQQPPEPQPGLGTVEDPPKGKNLKEAEAEAKQDFAQAMLVGKQQGRLPRGSELMMEVLEPKVPWQEKIARFLTEPARNDYTFSKPNLRYLPTGFIMPGLFNLEVGPIALAADTSMSMDEDALNRCGSEMFDISSTFNATLHVIYCDTKVQHTQEIEPFDDFNLEPKGGGGTDFRPSFEWLEKQGIVPKAIVYFTDGRCTRFPPEPEYPVLWAITGGYKFKPPFGEVIHMD
jgi:predicted metal-dependent peptidase